MNCVRVLVLLAAQPEYSLSLLACCCCCCCPAGEDVLKWLSFGHTSIPKTLGAEARILAFYYWLTYCILKAGKPKFEAIQAPAAAAAATGGAGGAGAGGKAAGGSSSSDSSRRCLREGEQVLSIEAG